MTAWIPGATFHRRTRAVHRTLLAVALLTAGCAAAGRAPTPGAPARPGDPIEVAVTIDDLPRHGPDIPGLSRLAIHQTMLAVLARHHVPGVYGFINAQKLEAHPEDRQALAAWVAAGQPLGNHSFSHRSAQRLTTDEFLADVGANEPVLGALAGTTAADVVRWKVFRFPYLEEGRDLPSRAAIRQGLLARGYRIAPVTIDFYDWAYNGPHARCLAASDTEAIATLKTDYRDQAAAALRWGDAAARELLGRPMKQILLLHVGAFGAEMLDDVLTVYEQNGVRFIALDDALGDPAYAAEPRDPRAIGGNFLYQIRNARGLRSPVLPPPPDTLLALACRGAPSPR